MIRISLVFAIFFSLNAFTQNPIDGPDIYVYGNLEDYFTNLQLDSCAVTIFYEEPNIEHAPQKSREVPMNNFQNGIFEFYLKFDSLYTIEFSRPGYVSKYLSIDARKIPRQARRFGFSMGPTKIGLFKPISSIDYSVFKNPLGKALYLEETKTFDYDTTYTRITSKEVKGVMTKHKTELKTPINNLVDNWHHAAAIADEKVYFNCMAQDAIFLGTDKTERWQKDVFEKWAQPHFEKDKAWAFTARDRMIYFHKDYQLAWFEELLDTWMGTCRGSGVVELTDDGWKIKHYNLALLVDNDKMDKVIEVMEKE